MRGSRLREVVAKGGSTVLLYYAASVNTKFAFTIINRVRQFSSAVPGKSRKNLAASQVHFGCQHQRRICVSRQREHLGRLSTDRL